MGFAVKILKVLVSDSSALIDLKRGGLLEAFFELPCEFIVPDVVLWELRSFTTTEKSYITGRATISKLESDDYDLIESLVRQHQSLSKVDLFVFRTAQKLSVSILLTGDRRLRSLAESHSVRTHGILWVVESLAAELHYDSSALYEALRRWRDDPACRIGNDLLSQTEVKIKAIYQDRVQSS